MDSATLAESAAGAPAAAVPAVEYPCSDGLPMADSDHQNKAMRHATGALEIHFLDHEDVYIACDTLIYYREGDNRERVAPDVFVVLGVSGRDRGSYRLWEEGLAPQFVLEVCSASTLLPDLTAKRELYASLGVREYWQFDPTGETLGRRTGERLQGYRLAAGRYERLAAAADGSVPSEVLGLDVLAGGGLMRFRYPARGEVIRTWEEAERGIAEAKRGREEAKRARERAERGIAEAKRARERAEQARVQVERRLEAKPECRRRLDLRAAALPRRAGDSS